MMKETGLDRICVYDEETGASGHGFRRCVLKTLQGQISESSHRNTLYHEQEETTIMSNVVGSSHPMTADLGLEAVPAVRKSIEDCHDIDVFWRSLLHDGRESFIGCVQLSSDKSKIALKTTSFEFYPLHISQLNFRESFRRSLVSTGRTVVAYLPVGYIPGSECSSSKRQSTNGRKE